MNKFNMVWKYGNLVNNFELVYHLGKVVYLKKTMLY